MINHVSIGVHDIARSSAFYGAVLKPLGYDRMNFGDGSAGFGKDAVALWLGETDSPVPADPKSGLHICFDAPTSASVDAFYAAALGAGGRKNGEPGLRSDYGPNYYAAFVIDPDGYRIKAYCGADA